MCDMFTYNYTYNTYNRKKHSSWVYLLCGKYSYKWFSSEVNSIIKACYADLFEKYPRYEQIAQKEQKIDIRELQSQLTEEQVFIEYFYGDSADFVFVVNSVTSDVDRPKNNKENESVAQVISEKTMHKKVRDGHYDVGENGHMEDKRRDKYGD